MKKIFLPLVLIFTLILGLGIFVLPQNEFSSLENRFLKTNKYLSTETVNCSNAEEIMKDQFYFRDAFSKFFYTIKIKFNYKVNHNNEFAFLDEDVIDVGNGYLVNSNYKYDKSYIGGAEDRGYNINLMDEKYPEIKTYVYLPTRFEEIFTLGNNENFLDDMRNGFLCQLNSNIKYDSLDYNSLEEYQNYFYKSDFHWNMNGAYQGYCDIVNMINEDYSIGEIKEPLEINTFDYDFNGNVANKIGKVTEPEHLIDYSFGNIDNFVYYINGEITDYWQDKTEYIETGYCGAGTDYDVYYGPYSYQRLFDYKDESKPNLLIFADSYVNPIQQVLASHFNKTLVIDLRSRDDSFNLDEIIKEYDIDIILVCEMYYNLYINGGMFIPLD